MSRINRRAFEEALGRFEQAAVSFAQLSVTQNGSEAQKKAARVYDARRKILMLMIGE